MGNYGSMGELIDAVFATGRLGGMAEAADLWCSYIGTHWDAGATRGHTRMLRQQAVTEADTLIAEYVSEAVTLQLTLARHGVKLDGPGAVEAWFRDVAGAHRRDRNTVPAYAAPLNYGGPSPTVPSPKFYERVAAGIAGRVTKKGSP